MTLSQYAWKESYDHRDPDLDTTITATLDAIPPSHLSPTLSSTHRNCFVISGMIQYLDDPGYDLFKKMTNEAVIEAKGTLQPAPSQVKHTTQQIEHLAKGYCALIYRWLRGDATSAPFAEFPQLQRIYQSSAPPQQKLYLMTSVLRRDPAVDPFDLATEALLYVQSLSFDAKTMDLLEYLQFLHFMDGELRSISTDVSLQLDPASLPSPQGHPRLISIS